MDFPIPLDLTPDLEGQVIMAWGRVQGVLKGAHTGAGFRFRVSEAQSCSVGFPEARRRQLSWQSRRCIACWSATQIDSGWSSRRGDGPLFSNGRFQQRIPHALKPPSLIFDFSDEKFCRYLEALSLYIRVGGSNARWRAWDPCWFEVYGPTCVQSESRSDATFGEAVYLLL